MLDILRGIAVIGMVLHHGLVSYEVVFDKTVKPLYTWYFEAVQLVFVAVFLLVSGICTNYSRSVMRRGLIVCGAAALVSLATCVALPAVGFDGLQIYFGILHMFGLSMVLYALLQKPLEKIPPLVGVIVFTLAFAAYYVFYMTEPYSDGAVAAIFGALPQNLANPFLAALAYVTQYIFMIFGFLPEGLWYGDYYPLLPFFFLFIAGAYVGKYVVSQRFPKWFYTARCKPLELCGKYSLWVYLLHQPVIFGTMYLITFFVK